MSEKLQIPLSFLFILTCCVHQTLADETYIPYLKAAQIATLQEPQPADLQRQIVMLKAQARLTSDWPLTYRNLMDVYLRINRPDQARAIDQKYMALQNTNAMAQIQMVNIELQQYQTAENRRQYLEQTLKNQTNLLPEVISDIYRLLAEISWEDFETNRANKYLEFSLKRNPANLKSQALHRLIVELDKNASVQSSLEAKVSEAASQIMANPLNGVAAIKLATLAGSANLPDVMQSWLDYAEYLRTTFQPKQDWPQDIKLDLSESFLAVGKAREALKLIQLPTTNSTESGSLNEIRGRILAVIAAQKAGETRIAEENEQWLENYLTRSNVQKPTAEGNTLISLYFSLYTRKADLLLSQNAVKENPDSRGAKIALALALAKSGDASQAKKLLAEAGQPNNPLVLLTQYFIALNSKQDEQANKLLLKTAQETPYGPLREALSGIAKQNGIEKLPSSKVDGIVQRFKQFGSGWTELGRNFSETCKLTLTVRGDLRKGQPVELTANLANIGQLPLAIGPEGFIGSQCLVEIQSVGGNGPSFVIGIPIEAKQILLPRKSVTQMALLGEAVSADGKTTWDEFVANHREGIVQVEIRAKVFTTAWLTAPVGLELAVSPSLPVGLPAIGDRMAQELVNILREPVTHDQWQLAQLVKWCLMSGNVTAQKADIIAAVIEQMKGSKTCQTLASLAWVLRAARPSGEIFNALAEQLKSQDWLTRLMVLDTLGEVQGKTARPLFEHYAANDKDDLVRQLSAGYLIYRY